MTLDEAIKILDNIDDTFQQFTVKERKTAAKLGTEALKWRKLMENDYASLCGPLLPGQTREEKGGTEMRWCKDCRYHGQDGFCQLPDSAANNRIRWEGPRGGKKCWKPKLKGERL